MNCSGTRSWQRAAALLVVFNISSGTEEAFPKKAKPHYGLKGSALLSVPAAATTLLLRHVATSRKLRDSVVCVHTDRRKAAE